MERRPGTTEWRSFVFCLAVSNFFLCCMVILDWYGSCC